jgi:hypothetical protein
MLVPRQQCNNPVRIQLDRWSFKDSSNLLDMVLLSQNQGSSIQIHKKTGHLRAKRFLCCYSTYQLGKVRRQKNH